MAAVIPMALVNERKRQVSGLTALAVRDLMDIWPELSLEDLARLEAQLIDLLPLIGDEYANAVAVTGADWYEDLRAEYVGGAYSARLGKMPEEGQYRALAGFALQPLYESPDSAQKALSRAAGGLTRLIRQSGRETIIENVLEDPRATRWARAASAGACAFCAMLATRGAAYTSEESASFSAHDWCNCEAVPVFEGTDVERPSFYSDYEDAYDKAAAAVRREKGSVTDYRAVLSEMRKHLNGH